MLRRFAWKNYIVIGSLGLIVLLASMLGLGEKAELGAYDTWFNLRGVEAPGKDIVIVAMDEKSMEKLGPLPWSRAVHARLLDKLREAKVVGFDVFFDGPTDPLVDKALAKAIARHGHVVLATMFAFEQDENGQWAQRFKVPLTQLAEAAAGLGFINTYAEKGNIVRRVTLIDVNTLEQPIPSFSVAISMTAAGLGLDDLTLKDGTVSFGGFHLPVSRDNQVLIDFWGPARTFPTYSYIDVLEGHVSPDNFRDAIVLVGIFTPTEQSSYGDTYENPFTKGNLVLAGALPCPGVEIHASAIKTYYTNRYFQRAPRLINLAILILAWLATVFLVRNRSPRRDFLSALILAVVLAGGVYLVWLKAHYWLNVVSPLAMVGLVYTGGTVENIVRTELERRRTRAIFSRYVAPSVVDEILKDPDAIQLGGVKRVVTVMFADIRGFTAYSENRDPVDVIARLNEYLTVMTEAIQNNGGTLDKYLGDGLMAFFGAPLCFDDHVEKAIKAAIEMQQKVDELNRKWEVRGAPPFKVAVGINTGPAVVGNVGSPERMDYTLIGEDVNLASRVEALSKLFETLIVISERSYNMLPEGELKASLYYLGAEQVKGFSDPVACYSVAGMDLHFEKSIDPGFK